MEISTTSIYEQFEKVSRDSSEKTALVYLGKKYTFSQLHEAVEILASNLNRLGVVKGS
jgi:acyl-CoA synthetase (AMP-forming)/AMP-acid ligase II